MAIPKPHPLDEESVGYTGLHLPERDEIWPQCLHTDFRRKPGDGLATCVDCGQMFAILIDEEMEENDD